VLVTGSARAVGIARDASANHFLVRAFAPPDESIAFLSQKPQN
jgi:hypothetical protein